MNNQGLSFRVQMYLEKKRFQRLCSAEELACPKLPISYFSLDSPAQFLINGSVLFISLTCVFWAFILLLEMKVDFLQSSFI